jgi:hypothetical protein
LPYDPAILFLRINSVVLIPGPKRDIAMPMFIAALSPKPKNPSINEQIIKIWYIYAMSTVQHLN